MNHYIHGIQKFLQFFGFQPIQRRKKQFTVSSFHIFQTGNALCGKPDINLSAVAGMDLTVDQSAVSQRIDDPRCLFSGKTDFVKNVGRVSELTVAEDDEKPAASVTLVESDFEAFFAGAPKINPGVEKITGVVCGVRVEEVEDPVLRNVRRLDKLVDELAKGRPLEKILSR